MKKRLALAALLAVATLAFAALRHLARFGASIGYDVRADFTTVPADDANLESWLKSQPGIIPDTVTIRRVDGTPTTLEVFFIQSRNLFGHPPIPPLDTTCQRLGYSGPNSRFRDVQPR